MSRDFTWCLREALTVAAIAGGLRVLLQILSFISPERFQ